MVNPVAPMSRLPNLIVSAAVLTCLSALAGCAESSATRLPETGAIGRPLLSPAEQQREIADMTARKRQLDAAAARPAQSR